MDSAPIVRPENPRSNAMNSGRGAPAVYQNRRANFRQPSTASAPLLQKNARGSPDAFVSRSASGPWNGWKNRFDVWTSVPT